MTSIPGSSEGAADPAPPPRPASSGPAGAGSRAAPLRRFALAALLLALLIGLYAPFFIDPIDRHGPLARGGEVNFATWGPLKAAVELKGQWNMVWRSAPAPGAT